MLWTLIYLMETAPPISGRSLGATFFVSWFIAMYLMICFHVENATMAGFNIAVGIVAFCWALPLLGLISAVVRRQTPVSLQSCSVFVQYTYGIVLYVVGVLAIRPILFFLPPLTVGSLAHLIFTGMVVGLAFPFLVGALGRPPFVRPLAEQRGPQPHANRHLSAIETTLNPRSP